MYHCLWNQGSVGTTPALLFARLFTVCCSNQRIWVGSRGVGAGQSLPQLGVSLWPPPPYLRLLRQAHVPAPVPAQGFLPGAAVREMIIRLPLHHLRAQSCSQRPPRQAAGLGTRVPALHGLQRSVRGVWCEQDNPPGGSQGRFVCPFGSPRPAMCTQRPVATCTPTALLPLSPS